MRTPYLLTLLPLALCTIGAAQTFVYVNNDILGPNSVSAYSVDSHTGALTALAGSPFLTGGNGETATSIANHRIRIVNDKLFVTNSGSLNISVFSINPATGTLTLVPGSPFPVPVAGPTFLSLAVTPDGKHLYVADPGGHISSFSVAPDGALTAIGSPLPTPSAPTGITVAPSDGKFLAVGLSLLNQIAVFSIDPATGVLSAVPGSPFTGPGEGLDCNCAEDRLFGGTGQTVAVYSIDPTGFALSQITGSPFAYPITDPVGGTSVFLSPDDHELYVTGPNASVSGLDVFSVADIPVKGALSRAPDSPFTDMGGFGKKGVATDAAGLLVFAADYAANKISVFGVTFSTPFLFPMPGSPFANTAGANPSSLAVFPGKTCCTAPAIGAASASPNSLWPPDSKFVEVTIAYDVTAPCPGTCVLTVASNEPIDNPSGDWAVVDAHHVMLRAERLGGGTGRIYTITITCTNNSNALSSSQSVTVVVPHNQ